MVKKKKTQCTYAFLPNWRFNTDTTMGYRFAIVMAHGGTLCASRSDAG